jgi:hypothetical protein
MPVFQGFFDNAEDPVKDRFMITTQAMTVNGARQAFNTACPDTHKLTAIAQQVGAGRQKFVDGTPFDPSMYEVYLKDQRELADDSPGMTKSEKELDDATALLKTLPDLKNIRAQNGPPQINPITNAIGWILLALSVLIGVYMLESGIGAVQALATLMIPSIIAGLLLISVAWSLKALSSIKASMPQCLNAVPGGNGPAPEHRSSD